MLYKRLSWRFALLEEPFMEIRFNPLLNQWVMVSSVRKKRPWRPKDFCPFCPGTEEMGIGWDVKYVRNKFPMLKDNPPKPKKNPPFKSAPSFGECLVLVETSEHNPEDLNALGLEQMIKVVKMMQEITEKYMKHPKVNYVAIFRNKGKEIGVSLLHPHSQAYAMPFIPLRIRVELENSRKYFKRFGRCLFCDILSAEIEQKERIIYSNNRFYAFLPYFANWPFEVHVYPKRHIQLLTQLNDNEIRGLADILRAVTASLNTLFNKSMPYVMTIHQAPVKGKWDYYHLHIEFYPILRDENKLKYAAGIEMGTWSFTYDFVPEENAYRLREALRKALEKRKVDNLIGNIW